MALNLVVGTSARTPDGFTCTTSGVDTTGANLLICSVTYYGTVPPLISDNGLNTWTGLTPYIAGNVSIQIFYARPGIVAGNVGAGHTVTVQTPSPGTPIYHSLAFYAYQGITHGAPVVAQSGNASGSATSLTTGTVTPDDVGQLLVTAMAGDAPSGVSGASWLVSQPAVSGVNWGHGYGHTYGPTQGVGVSPTWTQTQPLGLVSLSVAAAIFRAAVPVLTSISPTSGVQGITVKVTLTGQDCTGCTVSVYPAASGVTVANVVVQSNTQVTADVILAPTAIVSSTYYVLYLDHPATGVSNTVPFAVVASTPLASAGLIVTQAPQATRNDFSGTVGFNFTVGATARQVTALGRWNSGGFNYHQVLLRDSAWNTVATASVGGGTVGTWVYTPITPVTLGAGAGCVLTTAESIGGDPWLDSTPVLPDGYATIPQRHGEHSIAQAITAGGTNRSDAFSVGYRFTAIGAYYVMSLGRWKQAGDSHPHTILLKDSAGVVLRSAVVDFTGGNGADNAFNYTTIPPLQLTAGASYYLESTEGNGDPWFGQSTISIFGGVTVDYSVYEPLTVGNSIPTQYIVGNQSLSLPTASLWSMAVADATTAFGTPNLLWREAPVIVAGVGASAGTATITGVGRSIATAKGTAGTTASPYAAAVIADGATNYWRLGEPSGTTAVDVIGGKNGTISGGVTLGQPGPLSDGNTAMLFDGTTGKVLTTASVPMPLDVTVESWFKLTDAADYRPWFSTRNPTDVGGAFVLTVAPSSSGANIFCYSTGFGQVFSSRSQLADGQWHHVVFVFSGGTTCTIYLDGVFDATGSAPRPALAGQPVSIGHDQPGLGAPLLYSGSIDEVAIYPVALTPAQIANHYQLRTSVWSPVTGVGRAIVARLASAAGTTTVTGVSRSIITRAGTAAGTSTVTAVGAALVNSVGHATGMSVVSGLSSAGTSIGVGIATTAGSATVTGIAGTVTAIAATVATTAGSSTVVGVGSFGTTTVAAVATTSGSSTVTGVTSASVILSATGSTVGLASVTANGVCLAEAVASSAGLGTASGVGTDGNVIPPVGGSSSGWYGQFGWF